MPKRIINFDLDLNKRENTLKFQAKDFEDLEVNVTIKNNGQVYNLDGCKVDFVSTHGAEEILSVLDNVIKFTFNTGAEREKVYEGEITIVDEEGVLKTPSFFFYVGKSLSGEISIGAFILKDSEGYILKDSEGYILKVRG